MTSPVANSVAFLGIVICAAGGCSSSNSTETEQPPTTTSVPSSPAITQEDDEDNTDLNQLEGVWLMVSGEQRGEKTPQDIVSESLLTIKDGDLAHTVVGVITLKGPFVIDVTKNPKSIDVNDSDGPTNGKKLLGIYELSGDELKLCFSLPDKERPVDFEASAYSGNFSTVWKRNKEPVP